MTTLLINNNSEMTTMTTEPVKQCKACHSHTTRIPRVNYVLWKCHPCGKEYRQYGKVKG